MSTLIWKELRENIGWALLAMLALGGAEYYALHHQQYPVQMGNFNDGITLCKRPFLMVTTFGCAAAGLALGLLQMLPELKRDRWATLLHRPISRGRLFCGKAVAGLLLYLIATGLPFLAVVWHVATPGNFAVPFVPEMIRPGLVDLVSGFAYYFAALLMALQGGSLLLRALPLFTAVHVSFFALDAVLFRVAVAAATATALALCLAGWGAIYSRESLRGRPWPGRIAFFVVAFFGACGLGDLTASLGKMAGDMGDQKFSLWRVLDNGQPVRLDYLNDVLISATGVDGQPFTDPKYRPDRVRNFILPTNMASSYVGDSHGWREGRSLPGYRATSTYLQAQLPSSYPRIEQWFYLRQSRLYVGMLLWEKREIARLGREGFAPPRSIVADLPEGTRTQEISSELLAIATPESLHFAYLSTQKWMPIDLPTPGPIYGIGRAWANSPTRSLGFVGIALEKGMAVYDTKGRPVATLPYHQDVDRWGRLSIGVDTTANRFFLQYQPSDWLESKMRNSMPGYVESMDAQGTALASFTLPPLPPDANPPTWSDFIALRLKSPAFFAGELLLRRLGAPLGSTRLRNAFAEQLGRDVPSTVQLGCIVLLVALSCSALTFFWARRSHLSPRHASAWAAGVFVLGLPGFIIFWLVGDRPRAVPCPACRRPRRIDREVCSGCGAAWPAQPADDTGIIERATALPLTASA